MLLGARDAREFLVEPSPSVLADLRALSEALDEPGGDLESLLRELGASCALAVTSCLGFSITVVVDSVAVGVVVLEAPPSGRRIVTSVTIPLAGLADVAAGSEITFYATTPGALVDLAADLGHALGLGPNGAQFDKRLTPGASSASGTRLDHAKARNQAIGILLDQGRDLDEARAELDRLALRARDRAGVDSQEQGVSSVLVDLTASLESRRGSASGEELRS